MAERSPFLCPNFEQLVGCLIDAKQSLIVVAECFQLAYDHVHCLRILRNSLLPLRALKIFEEGQDKESFLID